MGRGPGQARPRVTDPAPGTEYLSLEDLLDLVNALGAGPIRDLGLLDSASHRPQASLFGREAYPTLAGKAAALLHSVAGNHALVDGSKRLALLATAVFLNQRLRARSDRRRSIRPDHVRGRRTARRRRDLQAASTRESTLVTHHDLHSRRSDAIRFCRGQGRAPRTRQGPWPLHGVSREPWTPTPSAEDAG